MPGKKPNKIRLYRITHRDNLEFIVLNGMYTKHSPNRDPNYIDIGDNSLIAQRNDYPISIPPNGTLGTYVPFYFGPLSPMLFNIKTGYRGIRQRSQSEIIYIVCEANSIVDACDKWCFIDGHAKNHITEFFNQLVDLDHVNWDVVRARYWHNDDDNYDKMRQKQAEFLVKDHVPAKCINAIVVFDSETENIVNLVLQRNGMNISVYVNPNNNFYY